MSNISRMKNDQWSVTVNRTLYQSAVVIVDADTKDEAERVAIEKAAETINFDDADSGEADYTAEVNYGWCQM